MSPLARAFVLGGFMAGAFACAAPTSDEAQSTTHEAVSPAIGLWGYELTLDSVDGAQLIDMYAAFAARGMKRANTGVVTATTQIDHAGQWYWSPAVYSTHAHALPYVLNANGDVVRNAAPLSIGDFSVANDPSEFLRLYGELDVYNVTDAESDWEDGPYASTRNGGGDRQPWYFAQYAQAIQGSESAYDAFLNQFTAAPSDLTPWTERVDPKYWARTLGIAGWNDAIYECSVSMGHVFQDLDGPTLYAWTNNASASHKFSITYGDVPHYADWHYEHCGLAPRATYYFTIRRVLGAEPPLGNVSPGDCALKTVSHTINPADLTDSWGETSNHWTNSVAVNVTWNTATQGYDVNTTESIKGVAGATQRFTGIKPNQGSDVYQVTANMLPHSLSIGHPSPTVNMAFPPAVSRITPIEPMCQSFSGRDATGVYAFDGVTPHNVEVLTLSSSARLELWGEYDAQGHLGVYRLRYVRVGLTGVDVMMRRTIQLN